MRVLCLDQFSESGGAQLCLRDVLREVRDRNWAATVMAPAGPLLGFAESLGCETAPLPLSKYSNGKKSGRDFLRFPLDMFRCAALLRRKGPFDLCYVNGPRILPAAAGTRLPVLFHAHSLMERGYARMAVSWSLNRRAAVMGCSQFIARSLRRPVKVVYNGVADCGFQPRRRQGGEALRVGILGRIAPEKGHLDFIRVASQLRDRGRTRFIVAGAALFSDPAYERLVRERGAREDVEFRGWTDQPAEILHDLDILAVPSSGTEASPRVILEAMSAGAAVVAYSAGGIPELIRNRHDGLLTEECTSAALVKNIRLLAEDPDLRNRLAANARNTFLARFTVERFRHEVCDEMQAAASSASRCG